MIKPNPAMITVHNMATPSVFLTLENNLAP
jgi:hypothetical protein